MNQARQEGHILTGLLYLEPSTSDLHKTLQTTSKPLNTLKENDLCPGSQALDKINQGLR